MVETNVGKGDLFNLNKLLAAVIVLLFLCIAFFSFLNHDGAVLKEGTLVIKAGETGLGSLSIADIRKLPAVEKKMTVHSGLGNTESDFTCTPLLAVLNSIDQDLTQKYKKIIAKGIDNYTSVIDMSEVLQPDNVYIAYADFGKPLKTKTGGEGSMKIIICNDEFGQRFTNWLVSLELQ
ncbi:hypothetical protein Dtox_3483 [Desulfofarcimen acetoxidans DSM 771]|jgi:hypothetical protein|uniref:Oxidoreductase molybdopterin-binding domain-containing protein n=1 Tax=Desulfofarcimen acetoxidans (strain ATCC 49208 / DSM 771 / KCTC 5769 / VKM B-1644 / 5575) TaxID=485916 RepID=C8W6U3_DESAS|nr:hypothetical protein [Desulfofarcimen acetoxidans]ACV64202.1 hypothetical protein Dtox_3483 [Desulfofarcimen acetoxidans DSM 771]